MALTNSASLSAAMGRLRSHGITRDKNLFQHAPDGPWYYEQIDLGLNYRLTDIAAALGLSQFQRLDSFVVRRNEIARDYDSLFSGSIFTTGYVNSFSHISGSYGSATGGFVGNTTFVGVGNSTVNRGGGEQLERKGSFFLPPSFFYLSDRRHSIKRVEFISRKIEKQSPRLYFHIQFDVI
jgi:hypothetical protein